MVDGGAKAVRQPLCQDPVNHPNRHLQIGFGIFGIMVTNLLLHTQSGLLCGAALPELFFAGKNTTLVFLQPKTMFLAFY